MSAKLAFPAAPRAFVRAALACALLAGCSFKSKIRLEVQVYGGETQLVRSEPDYLDAAAVAAEVTRSLERTRQDVADLGRRGTALVGASRETIQATGKELKSLSEKTEFKTQFDAYLDALTAGARELNDNYENAAAASRPAVLKKGTTDIRKKLYDDKDNFLFVVDGVNTESFFRARALTLAAKKDFAAILSSLASVYNNKEAAARDSAADALSETLQVDATRKLFTETIANVKIKSTASSVPYSDAEIESLEKTFGPSRSLELSAKELTALAADGGPIAKAVAEAAASRDAIAKIAGASLSSDKASNALDDDTRAAFVAKTADLIAVIQDVEKSLTKEANALQRFEVGARVLRDQTGKESNPLSRIAVRLPKDLLAKATIAASGIPSTNVVETFQIVAAELLRDVEAARGHIRAATARARNAVSTIRGEPFAVGDPNLKTITNSQNEDNWHRSPLLELAASGDGNAEYVIVQDGSEQYRLKKLRVDPQGVVELQLSISDAAIDVLSAVASAAAGIYGIPLPGSSKSGDAANAEGGAAATPDRTAEERALADEYQQTVRQMKKALETMTGTNATFDDAALAKGQGTLKGYKAKLDSFIRLAESLSSDVKKNDESKETPPSAADDNKK